MKNQKLLLLVILAMLLIGLCVGINQLNAACDSPTFLYCHIHNGKDYNQGSSGCQVGAETGVGTITIDGTSPFGNYTITGDDGTTGTTGSVHTGNCTTSGLRAGGCYNPPIHNVTNYCHAWLYTDPNYVVASCRNDVGGSYCVLTPEDKNIRTATDYSEPCPE